VLKGGRALLQKWQIVQRVEQILVALVTARMRGDEALLVEDVDDKRIGAQREVPRRLVDRHRVAIGLKDDLRVGGEGDQAFHTTRQVARGQRAQEWLFVSPGGANGGRLTRHRALVVVETALQQLGIEVVK